MIRVRAAAHRSSRNRATRSGRQARRSKVSFRPPNAKADAADANAAGQVCGAATAPLAVGDRWNGCATGAYAERIERSVIWPRPSQLAAVFGAIASSCSAVRPEASPCSRSRDLRRSGCVSPATHLLDSPVTGQRLAACDDSGYTGNGRAGLRDPVRNSVKRNASQAVRRHCSRDTRVHLP